MASAVLTWDPVTTNADGTPITDLKGYKIYRGLDSATPTFLEEVGLVTTYTDSTLPSVNASVTYNLTAVDRVGNESNHSVALTKVYDANPPQAPTLTGLDVVVE